MVDQPVETYEQWLERTEPPPSHHVSWGSWVGVFIGLLLIFPMNAAVLGCLVLGNSLVEPITVFRRTSSARAKLRLSVMWTCVWALAETVVLVRTDDHDWAWWLLLSLSLVMVVLEGQQIVRYARKAS